MGSTMAGRTAMGSTTAGHSTGQVTGLAGELVDMAAGMSNGGDDGSDDDDSSELVAGWRAGLATATSNGDYDRDGSRGGDGRERGSWGGGGEPVAIEAAWLHRRQRGKVGPVGWRLGGKLLLHAKGRERQPSRGGRSDGWYGG